MTDDDICGVECADGTPCQHPPNCPVPAHSDPDADNPQGRTVAIDEGDHDAILQAARDGMSKAGCARMAGCERDSLNRYLDDNPEFRAAFTRARAKGENELVRGALYEAAEGEREMDGQHARFLLSTSFGYQESKEVEHSGDVDLSVTADFSDTST